MYDAAMHVRKIDISSSGKGTWRLRVVRSNEGQRRYSGRDQYGDLLLNSI